MHQHSEPHCKGCGRVFVPKRKGQEFCEEPCRLDYYKRLRKAERKACQRIK